MFLTIWYEALEMNWVVRKGVDKLDLAVIGSVREKSRSIVAIYLYPLPHLCNSKMDGRCHGLYANMMTLRRCISPKLDMWLGARVRERLR